MGAVAYDRLVAFCTAALDESGRPPRVESASSIPRRQRLQSVRERSVDRGTEIFVPSTENEVPGAMHLPERAAF